MSTERWYLHVKLFYYAFINLDVFCISIQEKTKYHITICQQRDVFLEDKTSYNPMSAKRCHKRRQDFLPKFQLSAKVFFYREGQLTELYQNVWVKSVQEWVRVGKRGPFLFKVKHVISVKKKRKLLNQWDAWSEANCDEFDWETFSFILFFSQRI